MKIENVQIWEFQRGIFFPCETQIESPKVEENHALFQTREDIIVQDVLMPTVEQLSYIIFTYCEFPLVYNDYLNI